MGNLLILRKKMNEAQITELLRSSLNRGDNGVYSKDHIEDVKFQEFVKYLIDKDVISSIVKFLIQLRAAEKKVQQPLQAFKQYYLNYTQQDTTDGTQLMNNIFEMRRENEKLRLETEDLSNQIDAAKA